MGVCDCVYFDSSESYPCIKGLRNDILSLLYKLKSTWFDIKLGNEWTIPPKLLMLRKKVMFHGE